jgi:hypothetical protein
LAVGDVEQAGTDDLVARYAAAARRHGQATVTGAHTANADADEIAAIYRELRSRGSSRRFSRCSMSMITVFRHELQRTRWSSLLKKASRF